MIAFAAHSSESLTSANRLAGSKTAGGGESAVHALSYIRNTRMGADQTRTIDHDYYRAILHLYRRRLPSLPELMHDFIGQQHRTPQTFMGRQERFPGPQQERYFERLMELRDLANDEGISPLRLGAEQDFLRFLATRGFSVRKASLALLDDGALGATWRNERWRLNLQFRGDGRIDYVLLDRTNPPEGATGKSDLSSLDSEFERLDLKALLTE